MSKYVYSDNASFFMTDLVRGVSRFGSKIGMWLMLSVSLLTSVTIHIIDEQRKRIKLAKQPRPPTRMILTFPTKIR